MFSRNNHRLNSNNSTPLDYKPHQDFTKTEEFLTSNDDDKLQLGLLSRDQKKKYCMKRICLLESKKQILAIDVEAKLVNIFDLNGNFIEKIHPNHLLLSPHAIIYCQNLNQIFISDHGLSKTLVFDENFRFQRDFAPNINVNSMAIDRGTNLLYSTVPAYNLVTIWNTMDGSFVSQFSITTPKQIQVSNAYVSIPVCFRCLRKMVKKSIFFYNKLEGWKWESQKKCAEFWWRNNKYKGFDEKGRGREWDERL